ncbi:aromatic ring-opening dioxygenase LigB subunit [Lophiotrema nucula]|uniref:Aromatic ring-opening dioxygenase LigB subunit n=1 Tax=Lophiotrema nucula TaxID=690887 RepID=A0A6A5YUA1_9PLEO|nr:aromatic ring-opening dioxygenase LigB subunit [Lophiotrema nucula]
MNATLATASRTPVYFLSIGGPNFIEATEHPAYAALSRIGHEITTNVKPKAVLVLSAHWQSAYTNRLEINVASNAPIIYDFYNFPKHYYEVQYPNRGSPEIAERVIEKLGNVGIEVERVERGLDHGVWAGFLAAFDPKTNPVGVPIVQVSLLNRDDPEGHYKLGQALQSLRDEGVCIIACGMAVHNLQDFRKLRMSGESRKVMPYVHTFDEALKDAATAAAGERKEKMLGLMKEDLARRAHPTIEHVLPVFVAAGAAGGDVGERVWTMGEGSLSWAQYRFGDVA